MFRRAWRRLWATPLFTVFAVTSLSLGVGVTTAIYSVAAYVANPGPAWTRADRIAVLTGTVPYVSRPEWRSALSWADFEELRRSASALSNAAASAIFSQAIVDDAVSEVVVGEAVTGNYFDLFGVLPVRG